MIFRQENATCVCEQSLYLNSKLSLGNEYKIEGFSLVFKSFCYMISKVCYYRKESSSHLRPIIAKVKYSIRHLFLDENQ